MVAEFLGLSLWQNIVADLMLLGAGGLYIFARRLGAKNLRTFELLHGLVLVIAVFSNVILQFSAIAPRFIGLALAGVLFTLTFRALLDYWKLGLVRADRTVADGIDYEKSLKMCNNEIWFLGLGASKLTQEKEFNAAVKRCHREGNAAVRFLLLDPDVEAGDVVLSDAEKVAETRDGTYRQRVRDSLQVLTRLKAQRLNIEVRVYDPYTIKPNLRLMFVDDTVCLMSHYTTMGAGDGSQLPQLCFLNPRHLGEQAAKSFYAALRRHFEWAWSLSRDYKPSAGKA